MTEDSMPESLPTGILPDGATNLEDVLVAGNAEVPTISESNPKSGVAPAPVAVSDEAAPSWFRGIAEAVGWWFGTLLVHVLAGAFMAIGLIVFNILNGKAKPADIMNSESMLLITAGEMILFVLASILAVSPIATFMDGDRGNIATDNLCFSLQCSRSARLGRSDQRDSRSEVV